MARSGKGRQRTSAHNDARHRERSEDKAKTEAKNLRITTAVKQAMRLIQSVGKIKADLKPLMDRAKPFVHDRPLSKKEAGKADELKGDLYLFVSDVDEILNELLHHEGELMCLGKDSQYIKRHYRETEDKLSKYIRKAKLMMYLLANHK